MSDPTTPILGLDLPIVGGDANVWGESLNDNFETLDNLGATPVVSVNAAYVAVVGDFPETIYRCATGGSPLAFTLPSPSSCTGKIFTIKKVDSGGGYVNVIGPIDGQSSYFVVNLFAVVRIVSNGGSFDVIGVY